MAKFQIFNDSQNQFRFRLKSSNGEIVASSEGYTSKQSAEYAVNFIKKYAANAEIEDLTKSRTLPRPW